jgi:hypothetical protein
MAVTLQLTVPSPAETGKRKVAVKPREVAEWLDNLPFLDLQRTAPAIHKQLRLFNRQPMAPGQRLDILAAFRGAYGRLKHAGSAHTPDGRSPLESLCKKLAQDTTFGYKIALQDLLQTRWPPGQRRALGQAIAGALEGMSEQMTYCYASGQRIPRALWNEAVTLFRFCRDKKLEDSTLPHGDGGTISAGTLFRALALLRLADPYQMQPGVVWHLLDFLTRYADRAELVDPSLPGDPQQRPPLVIDGQKDGQPPLLVDVTPLIEQIEASIRLVTQKQRAPVAGFPEAEVTPALILHTLKRLRMTWSSQIDRRWERTDVHQRLEIVFGLSACWYVANGDKAFDPAQFHCTATDEIDLSMSKRQDVAPKDQTLHRCSSINRSAGGVALRIDRGTDMPAYPGQVVGLRRAGGTSRAEWVIGVCRWQIERSGSADIGVQFIARYPKPVAIERPDARVEGAVLPALVVEQSMKNTPVRQLITPAGSYRETGQIVFYENGHKKSIRCQQLVDASQDFEQFVFKVIDEDL